MKLLDIINEIKMSRTWDMDKEEVDPKNIKVGDTMLFNIPHYETLEPTQRKQLVLNISSDAIHTCDIINGEINYKAKDYWFFKDILSYQKKQK